MHLTKSMELTKEELKGKAIWWRLLLVVIVFFAAQFLFGIIYGVVTIVMGMSMTEMEELMNLPLIQLLSFPFILLVLLLFNRFTLKKSVMSLGFFKESKGKKYSIGMLLGFGAFILVYLLNFIFQGVTSQVATSINWIMILLFFVAFAIQGMTEEVLVRGLFMNIISGKMGVLVGIISNSLFFAVLHMANPNVTFLSIFNIFIFGLLFSMLFYWSDNMWLTGAAHSIWNFTMGPVLGIEVSGMVMEDTIFKTISSPDKTFINGGLFGLEGGIITTIVGIAGCAVLWYLCVKKGLIKK